MLQEDEGRPESVFLGVFQMLPYQEGPGRWAGARAGGQARPKGREGLPLPCCLEAISGFRSLQLGRRRGGLTSRPPAEGEG